MFRVKRDNWWFSFWGIMVGESIFINLLHREPWWLVVAIALMWFLAGWFIGSLLWNRLFPCYLNFTDMGISIGKIQYSVDIIESISMPIGKRASIGVYLNFPLKPVQIKPWTTKNEELRNQLKHWSAFHGISFMEPLFG